MDSDGYLNNESYWWTLTSCDDTSCINSVDSFGQIYNTDVIESFGVRPTINLKSSVEIASGSGTESDPYRLKGDNDIPTSGTKLTTRYSGEYIRFGTGENNLYQIVSHETDELTKIVSAIPLKESESWKGITFASSGSNYSSSNTIGAFLNGEYLTSGSYLTTAQVNMVEDNTTWYLGAVGDDPNNNYILAKYDDETITNLTSNIATAKVGLLRLGELNAGQFDNYSIGYWTLTPCSTSTIFRADGLGKMYNALNSSSTGIRPTINLKSNVVITSGDGTKDNPFEVSMQ